MTILLTFQTNRMFNKRQDVQWEGKKDEENVFVQADVEGLESL